MGEYVFPLPRMAEGSVPTQHLRGAAPFMLRQVCLELDEGLSTNGEVVAMALLFPFTLNLSKGGVFCLLSDDDRAP